MNIALYFGSFNPIHIGHLIIANFAVQQKEIDEVWMVVSPQNPLKNENQLLNEHHRLQLLRLALEGEHKIKASNIEFQLPKPSYTVDTLIYLGEKYPKYKFDIIIGSDSFLNLSNWKNPSFLKKNCFFWVYERTAFPIINENGYKYKKLEAPILNISSTLIRKMIKEKKSIRYLVPDSVAESILINNYYMDKLKNPTK